MIQNNKKSMLKRTLNVFRIYCGIRYMFVVFVPLR